MISVSSPVCRGVRASKMLSGFEKSVARFIEANRLIACGDKVLLAISGGADSLAQLHCLNSLRAAGVLDAELTIAHINHQLRDPDADADEHFVIEQARKLQLPVTVRRIDVGRNADEKKLSIETAARNLRAQELMDIARKNGCQIIATAHNKNDNAETVLHRLGRGTGFRGLAGIWPKKDFTNDITFIRPLLWASRDEITQYLQQLNLKWRHDRTNIDTSYTRNYIRHQLLPVLQAECKGRLLEHLSELARHCRAYYHSVMQRCEKSWPIVVTSESPYRVEFDMKVFIRQRPWVKVALVRKALSRLGCGEQGLTQQHYEKVLKLADENIAGTQVTLPRRFTVMRYRNTLTFADRQAQEAGEGTESVFLNIPGKVEYGNWRIEPAFLEAGNYNLEKFKIEKCSLIEWFDLDKLALPLRVRYRRPGDRFWPLGLAAEKKLGKFITAARVSPDLRRKVIVIADSEKIIWLAPLRPSEKTKITGQTKRILQIQLTSLH